MSRKPSGRSKLFPLGSPAWGVAALAACLAGGCAGSNAHDGPAGRPPLRAEVVDDNRAVGGVMSWPANRSGVVYVYDVDAGETVYTGSVRRGDTVRVDPDHNRVTINGAAVSTRDLKSSDRFQIKFVGAYEGGYDTRDRRQRDEDRYERGRF